MPMPILTAFYASLCVLLVLVLSARVVLGRRKYKVALGDGGERDLTRRIRVHANAIEYLPLALLLLLLCELMGMASAWVHAFGASLFIARVMHAWGLSHRSGPSIGRFVGTLVTWLVMILMATALLYHSALRMAW